MDIHKIDYDSDMDQRDNKILRVLLIEGIPNLTVLTIKVVVGVSTGSLAILSDAAHSFTDIVNNIIAWFVIRHSAKPADTKHPYLPRILKNLA